MVKQIKFISPALDAASTTLPSRTQGPLDGVVLRGVGARQRDKNGNVFLFVEYDDASSVSAVPGSPLGWHTSDEGSTVTTDLSRSTSTQLMGVAVSSIGPTNKYGWALVEGDPATVQSGALTLKTDGNVAAGTKLCFVADQVFDGRAVELTSTSRGTYAGIALEADSGSQLVKCRVSVSL